MFTLQSELDAYHAALPGLLRSKAGQYVVIHGQDLCDCFASYEEALSWAYACFGLDRFFVKHIEPEEQAVHFMHDLRPCRG